MTKNTAVWVLGSALVACVATSALVACSSSDDSTTPGGDAPRPDSGTDATTRADTGTEPGTDAGPGPGTADAGADCGRLPFVPSSNADGVRCPFQAKAADGGFLPINCKLSEHCCIYPVTGTVSTCNPAGVACEQPDAAVADFECQENADCVGDGGKRTCCVLIPQLTTNDRGCSGNTTAKGPTKTACRTSCAAGETPICTSDGGECTGSTTCTAFSAKTNFFGTCL